MISAILSLNHVHLFQFYLEPPDKLSKAVEEAGLAAGDFFTLKHGETLTLPPSPPATPAPGQ
jgi:hypothetical protein